MRKLIVTVLVVGALLIGCTAGDDTASEGTSGGSEDTRGSTPVPTGPAPGVTADSIKVGVTYVDLESLGDVATITHGDYEVAYQALFDDINESGGINGRTVEPVLVGVNPVGTDAADAACVQLTEDDDVFVVMGFFLEDAVLCPAETHETAVIGPALTPERLERAQAPWFSTEGSADIQTDVVRALAEAGELDGSVGVFGGPADEAQLNDAVLPLLDELGIEVTESALVDAPPEDIAATNAATAVIAERFETSGVDQVLVLGNSGLTWASGTENLDYRPELRLADPNSILVFVGDEGGRDLSVLDGAVSGGLYGAAQNTWELPAMQDCIAVIEGAGGEVPPPDSVGEDGEGDGLWVAGFNACRNVGLFRALVEAAGEDLNYGSLAAAADGLEVELSIQPDPLTYGPGAAADGDPTAYLFDWDPDEADFVLRED